MPSPHKKSSLFPNPFAPRKHTLHATKAREYHQMSSDELREALKKLKEAKLELECKVHQDTNKPLEHPSGQHKEHRKAIARIMTILVQRGERCV